MDGNLRKSPKFDAKSIKNGVGEYKEKTGADAGGAPQTLAEPADPLFEAPGGSPGATV